MQSFRDLRVWHSGMELVVGVYELTRTLPKAEAYGLSSQMQRGCFGSGKYRRRAYTAQSARISPVSLDRSRITGRGRNVPRVSAAPRLCVTRTDPGAS